MIASDKILPIRFYNNLYDQNRFNAQCYNNCQLDLLYPASQLPKFQLKRNSVFAYPSKFYLRNICEDITNKYYKTIPEGADTFSNSELVKNFYTFEVGGSPLTLPFVVPLDSVIAGVQFSVDLFDVDCGKFKMLSANIPNYPDISYIPLLFPIIKFPINNLDKYHFRIIVDKLCGTSTLNIYNGGNLLGVITSAGTYDFYFTSAATDIQVIPSTISYGDCMEISYMQATITTFASNLPTDIVLLASDLKITTMKDGTDIITYCNDIPSTTNIPEGTYYYVIETGSQVFFSEVFKVVSLTELQHYFKLEWYDDCDFNSAVIYRGVTNGGGICSLKNVLYLDAALFSPSYDTVEESEVNGKGDLNVRFKRWQKNISFEVGKSPEFLTDALSAIFLHKFITLTEPLNKYQDIQSQTSEILKVTSEVSDILSECFQRVVLKFLLEDKITDSACCNIADTFQCPPCKYVAGDLIDCGMNEYYLEAQDGNGNWWNGLGCPLPQFSYTLKKCSDGSIVQPRENDIICYNGRYITLKFVTGINCITLQPIQFWTIDKEYPTLISATFFFIGYQLIGRLIPYTFGRVQFQIDCAGPWILADIIQVGANGNFTYTLPISYVTPYMPFTSICFKVENVTLNCSMGDSNIKTVI
jgi:hypothetical protein